MHGLFSSVFSRGTHVILSVFLALLVSFSLYPAQAYSAELESVPEESQTQNQDQGEEADKTTDESDEKISKGVEGDVVGETEQSNEKETPESSSAKDLQALAASSTQSVTPHALGDPFTVTDSTNTEIYGGASLTDAFAAITASADTSFTITLGANSSVATSATVATGKNILLTSDSAGPYTLTQTIATRHFSVFGSLTLQNVILDGGAIGGGIGAIGGNVTLQAGSAVRNCYQFTSGGGISLTGGSTFTMEGGEISNNHTSNLGVSGGGIAMNDSTGVIEGGVISDNSSPWGGGIEVGIESSLTMNGGLIENNVATSEAGGGVHVYVHGTFTMNGGTIQGNQALDLGNGNGGGVFVGQGSHPVGEPEDWCRFVMNDGVIVDNDALRGGGISSQWNGLIEMNGGSILENTAVQAGGGVFVSNANADGLVSFTMTSGIISGNSAQTNYGGGICALNYPIDYNIPVTIGIANRQSGAAPIITNNSAVSQGGGIFLYNQSATMYDGVISSNEAGSLGGGVCVYAGSTFFMLGGTVGGDSLADANISATSGGGIASFQGGNQVEISNGRVANNIAESPGSGGGGIYAGSGDTFLIDNSIIESNEALFNGGGIYATTTSSVTISGQTSITGNVSANEGGGIYSADFTGFAAGTVSGNYSAAVATDYANLSIADTVSFSENSAPVAYQPPSFAPSMTHLGYARTSILNGSAYLHPLNNYDINWALQPIVTLYEVKYDPNGGTGSVYDAGSYVVGSEHTVLEPSDPVLGFTRDGFTLVGWSTDPAATVPDYFGGDLIGADAVAGDVIVLYAVWAANVYTVTYDVNGGDGSHIDTNLAQGSTYTVLSNTQAGIQRDGFTFIGWNTAADGSGTTYVAGDTFAIEGDVTLYAMWEEIPPIEEGNGGEEPPATETPDSLETSSSTSVQPQTGDGVTAFVLAGIGILAAFVASVAFFVRRKHQRAGN